ncbi:MAG TPA: cupin domain-containing protein [Candidatus Saccharimonadales bacterium]|nr:cupin domain-containing protein [Candidatus Saccharimonadales bacterium]
MTIQLQFDRIPPGVEIGPHRHGVETIVFVAAGELVFEHGEELERRAVVRAGDVLYEAPAEHHLVRNEGTVDALALLASVEPDERRLGTLLQRWSEAGAPVRRGDIAPVVEADGIARRLIVRPGDFGTATFTITEVTVAPGTADAWHRHPGAEHALVVFEGRGIVTVDDTTETLEPLVGIRVEPGLTHRVENTGRLPLRYYVCSSPGTDPLEDRELAEAPPRTLDA